MGILGNKRTTVYNKITSEEKFSKVNPDNIQLGKDFLEYLSSVGRAKSTIEAYRHDLKSFFCWNLTNNGNKYFVYLTKRDIIKFQNYAMNDYGWSPKRIRRMKATLSSLSNYIENILDDEYENYRPIINKIESPKDVAIRAKSVFSKEQLDDILQTLVEDGNIAQACMLSLAMNCGRRKSELVRMKVSYFTEDCLVCEGALYKSPEKVVTKGSGVNGKLLDVYTIAKPFKYYLDMWMYYRKEHNITSEWLIPRKIGGEYVDEQTTIHTMDSWANKISSICGIPFYWHSMRHYFTTSLAEANIPDSVIQEIVGWESADMCRIYNDMDATSKLSKYFGKDGIKQVEQKSLSDL